MSHANKLQKPHIKFPQIPTCVVNSELQLMKIANPDSSSLGVPLACAAVMIFAFLASHVH